MKRYALALIALAAAILCGAYYPLDNNLCRTGHAVVTGANLNSLNTDVGTFSGLPARYLVTKVYVTNASTSLSLATVDVRTTTGGGGTAIVSAAALTGLTTSVLMVNPTIAVTGVQTSATLTLRNVTPQGGAATADFVLEYVQIP